jgi:polysaccharide export outer membrane protein
MRFSITLMIALLFALISQLIVGAAQSNATGEYQLGAGDSIRISAYNNPDLTTEAKIAEDGTISFPLLGRVTLAGLTKSDAEKRLSQLLSDGGYLKQAAINIAITEYRSQQVSVIGAVTRPGKYPITSAASAMDVLAEAGGITPNGSWVIRLIQRDNNGMTSQRDIDLNQLVGSGENKADLSVHNGDVIFVAAQPVFYIYGEVQKPGAYPLQREMTVRQAIAAGGGLTLRGTERGIRVGRAGKSGAIEMHKVKLTDRLLAGDVVQVKESWF